MVKTRRIPSWWLCRGTAAANTKGSQRILLSHHILFPDIPRHTLENSSSPTLAHLPSEQSPSHCPNSPFPAWLRAVSLNIAVSDLLQNLFKAFMTNFLRIFTKFYRMFQISTKGPAGDTSSGIYSICWWEKFLPVGSGDISPFCFSISEGPAQHPENTSFTP